jgi:hypothetical protein
VKPPRVPHVKGLGKGTKRRKGDRASDPYGTQMDAAEETAAYLGNVVAGVTTEAVAQGKAARRKATASKDLHRGAVPVGDLKEIHPRPK